MHIKCGLCSTEFTGDDSGAEGDRVLDVFLSHPCKPRVSSIVGPLLMLSTILVTIIAITYIIVAM